MTAYQLTDKVAICQRVMDEVYGVFTGESWKPKVFENREPRYLWTDAYGVLNFLTLHSKTQDERYLKQALILVDDVHNVLGKSRDGSQRLGCASEEKPTVSGLRIGKPKSEGPGMSEDGQYYHYLTKWMFALNRLSVATATRKYNDWAIDLAKAAHGGFVRSSEGRLRMVWKMSIDLKTPLVPSEGGLDPYDGYTMFKIIQEQSSDKTVLAREISELYSMVGKKYPHYHTDDELDAGEALWLCSWFPEESWAKHLKRVAGAAVNRLWECGSFSGQSSHRLAFREFGTTIGVQEHDDLMNAGWTDRVEKLHGFWFNDLYSRDKDITPVMYCTSLIPGCSAQL